MHPGPHQTALVVPAPLLPYAPGTPAAPLERLVRRQRSIESRLLSLGVLPRGTPRMHPALNDRRMARLRVVSDVSAGAGNRFMGQYLPPATLAACARRPSCCRSAR